MESLTDFKNSLHSLKISKSQISSMTKKAETLVICAHAVVDITIAYINKVTYLFLCVLFLNEAFHPLLMLVTWLAFRDDDRCCVPKVVPVNI